MKQIVQNTRHMSVLVQLNADRLLVPLLISAALVLAAALFQYPAEH